MEAPESETDGKIVGTFPDNTKESGRIGKTLKAGDIDFSQPGAVAAEIDEVDGMCDGSVMHGKIQTGDEAVDAWCGGTMGGNRYL